MVVRAPLRVAVAGLGAIGWPVVQELVAGAVPGATVRAVSAGNLQAAAVRLQDAFGSRAPSVVPLESLASDADVIVECAPASVFREVVEPAVLRGRHVVCVSAAGLLSHFDLVATAQRHGAQIIVPSGAIAGLDAIGAAANAPGGITSVRMVTRKPPAGLAGAPHLVSAGIDVEAITVPTRVFAGSVQEGAAGFPANVNVAAAVGLAGDMSKTRMEVWADPTVTRNTHTVVVDAPSARLEVTIENLPSQANPRTGAIVAPSIVQALRRLAPASALVVGT